ncbi:MAG: hypothetical protein A2149_02375 [Candidatus Schekmanbacteria bacterium RBG_16_38_11]|uniref:DUF2283 domain-containing protein n=1 Tax=Candidatus Schekmanbacteria bacterium RBG_16_38_11 TaxID=1817880 RepID=A0A1F7RRQ8_9BACT|nr:MAG: hypothetical protein A2149_02375 [Candidatus Schekmanbacteria bacterium RBG_16_38_11]
MRIHYSQEADVLYIRLKETDIENSDEVTDDVIMDYDKKGNIVGIEILSASQKADVRELIIQEFEKVKVKKAKVA